MSESDLRKALKHKFRDRRFVAAYMVGERLLDWPNDMIPLLQDNSEAVRQAARRSLIIMSFLAQNPEEAQKIRSPQKTDVAKPLSELQQAKDFGPQPKADRTAQAKAAKEWRQWWADRTANTTLTTDPGTTRETRSAPDQ
jgi:hypothetical protein